MKTIILVVLFVVSIQALSQEFFIEEDLNDEWQLYKSRFGRKYEPINEIARRIIWQQNLKYIRQHNLEYDLGKHTYYLGINEFADMTFEEFQTKYLGLKPRNMNYTSSVFLVPENMNTLPPSVDWRTKGYVTGVKNQGQCGSCWSFSATGSLEGQHFRKTKSLVSLSEQQLVDCSGSFGNNGCNGGLMDNAFTYIQQFGIESEDAYPYVALDGQCAYSKSEVAAHCTGFKDIQKGNEHHLAIAVASVGPISVAIDASHMSFQLYKGGVYNEVQCSPSQLDHGVLAVGYGVDDGHHYWLVKNSWGTSWGLEGYIKMSKDKNNQCGIATMASYPSV